MEAGLAYSARGVGLSPRNRHVVRCARRAPRTSCDSPTRPLARYPYPKRRRHQERPEVPWSLTENISGHLRAAHAPEVTSEQPRDLVRAQYRSGCYCALLLRNVFRTARLSRPCRTTQSRAGCCCGPGRRVRCRRPTCSRSSSNLSTSRHVPGAGVGDVRCQRREPLRSRVPVPTPQHRGATADLKMGLVAGIGVRVPILLRASKRPTGLVGFGG